MYSTALFDEEKDNTAKPNAEHRSLVYRFHGRKGRRECGVGPIFGHVFVLFLYNLLLKDRSSSAISGGHPLLAPAHLDAVVRAHVEAQDVS